ncbi:hypothetical protein ACFVVA_37330 [Kitasatospora sp. NPDC058048]|uniref:hypothetical protein n=1 Tax=Kitasatospora sp. NPDC058048 TaxID=3346313 RepID=UPI0036DAF8A7
MRRASFAWTTAVAAMAAMAAVAVTAAPASAGQAGQAGQAGEPGESGEPGHGTPGTGEILPYPGPEGLIWIPDWIGDGGAVTGGAYTAGPPVTVTVGCRGGSGGAGEVRVTFTPYYGDTTPVEFTVPCPAEAVDRGSAVVTAEQGRSFHVGVRASAPDVHWGLAVTQPDA